MSTWGTKDSKAVTGTVAVTNASATVTGTGTAFTTELAVGNILVIASVEYRILTIASNTSLALDAVYAGVTAPTLTITAREKPNYVATSDTVDFVDIAEVAVTAGIAHAGWVQRQVVGSRNKYETLVAMSASAAVAGDADDDARYPDA